MKKLINNKFLFILGLSLVVLILLALGALYLFDDTDDTFVKSGYVLNPLSSKVERYFFEEDTSYHVNLSKMVEFNDVDNQDVKVLQDSFLHYNDGSLSFLKNGAILDIDSISGKKAVMFYNITNKSIITKKDNNYIIANKGEDIVLNNFIGRINDNKYIFVGSLSAKIPGNDTNIKGDYFEVVYVDTGVINIENKDVKYQVTAEGTVISLGDVSIDLGDKSITKNNEDIMSLTEITISGDENIEIVPIDEENIGSDGSSGDGTGTDGTTGGTGTEGDSGAGSGDGDSEEGDGSGTGTGGGNGDNDEGEIIKETTVTLKDASVGSTNVNVTFDIINPQEEDSFILKVTNLDTGRTIDLGAKVIKEEEIKVNLLSPNTKYLFTVINERNNDKYFQKIFETNSFGITLEKSYATDDTIAYKVTVDPQTDITNAKLSLYKYNEETKKNEIVKSSYYEDGNLKYIEKVTNLSKVDSNIEGTHEIVYDGLDSNTIYTAVLDEFSVASSNFKDVYNVTLSSMTLKKTPVFSNMSVEKNTGEGSFKLSLGNIEDKDNAIEKYTYVIYEKDNPVDPVIAPITKTNASPIEVKIGDKTNQLKNDTNYFYKVIIEYYDNEKYVEYTTEDYINFVMGDDPYVTVVPNDKLISYDRIGATIYLTDNSCLIPMPGREKCTGSNNVVVDVSKVNSITGEVTSVFAKVVEFSVNDNEIKYELSLDKLLESTTYRITVRANISNDLTDEFVEILHTDSSIRNITTKSLSSFLTEWNDKPSGAKHVVNLGSKFVAEEGSGTLKPEDSAEEIRKVVLKLYQGNNIVDLDSQVPIATEVLTNTSEFNIKENFYDNEYVITTDGTFGLDINALKEKNEGKLSEYYTIKIESYYDTDENNQVKLSNNVYSYKISATLLMDNVIDPIISLEPISNKQKNGYFTNLTNEGTTVGYKVIASIDINGLIANNVSVKDVKLYVYNKDKQKVKFYTIDESGKILKEAKEVLTGKFDETGYYETEIYMDYGTEYSINDLIMSRGNEYYIGYEATVIADEKEQIYPVNMEDSPEENGRGKYELVQTEKENPQIKMYVSKSTDKNITYHYSIVDPDNAIYRENSDAKYGMYYIVNSGEEKILELTETTDKVKSFEGKLTIDNLNKNDKYALYYKKNVTKSNNLSADVLNYPEALGEGIRIFEGEYKATDSEYNFKYEIINNPLTDNRVVIKILAETSLLDRVISYKVKFTDNKNNTLNKEIWQLNTCEEGEEEARCFSVDYSELMKMKGNTITVSIEALYDNGLSGFDYVVGEKKNSKDDTVYDYKYMIFQNNSTEEGLGKYISLSSAGNLTVWSDALGVSKGYYNYSFNTQKNKIYYTSKLVDKEVVISTNLTLAGYLSSQGTINPKMISVDKMNCSSDTVTDCSKFSFSSITPKVLATKKASLIDGAVMELTLSGAVMEDFKLESDGNYYLYIDTWHNSQTTAPADRSRPTIKVEIDKKNPSKTLRVVIDGLSSGKGDNYYFRVYAYLNKDGKYQKTQLFDAAHTEDYVFTTYEFKTLFIENVFMNFNTGYSAITKEGSKYGSRSLDTKITLTAYEKNEVFDFDLAYVLCDYRDINCNINNENSYILRSDIKNEDITTKISDSVDITTYDLEYGRDKGYNFYVYAITKKYEFEKMDGTEPIFKETKEITLLNPFSNTLTLLNLAEPNFTVERTAGILNNEHYIDFKISIKDTNRTIVDGNYYVKLLDENNNLVGTLFEKDKDDNYIEVLTTNYSTYAFQAATIGSKQIRITGLSENTKYKFVISTDVYRNNYTSPVTTYSTVASDCDANGNNCKITINPNMTISDKNYYIEVLAANGKSYGKLNINEEGTFKVEENYLNKTYKPNIINGQLEMTGLPSGTYKINIYDKSNRKYSYEKTHTVYSVDNYGVAFGKDLLFSATEKSIVVTFLGGSSFDNVSKVEYTIGLWDDKESISAYSGTYDLITVDDTSSEKKLVYNTTKKIEFNKDTQDWRFVIDPPGMTNILGQTYTIKLRFKVINPNTFEESNWLEQSYFEGRTQYVKDEK